MPTTITSHDPPSRSGSGSPTRLLHHAVAAAAIALMLGACGTTSTGTVAAGPAAAGPTAASVAPANRAAPVASSRAVSGGTTSTGGGEPVSEPGSTGDTNSPGVASPASTDPGDARQPALHSVEQAQNPNPNPDATRPTWADMATFMTFVIKDADSYWTPAVMNGGRPEPQVNFRFPAPGQVMETACGPTDDTTMFYCPTDDTIYFSQALAVNLWNGTYVGPDRQRFTAPGGDMAPAVMLAHEFAHSIQAELGITSGTYGVARTEKHADCWAGVWVASAASRSLLDPGDVNEALTTAFMVGDSQFDDAAHHHGTPTERMAAFTTGFQSGTPDACAIYLNS